MSTRVTTVGCGNTLTHITPHKRLGQARSPGQARPSLHKTIIDLMDLCAVHTPSPNKQSAQDLSPLRQRGSARPPLAKKTAREGSAALPNLLISLLGLGEGLNVLCSHSSDCTSSLPPTAVPSPRSATLSCVTQGSYEDCGALLRILQQECNLGLFSCATLQDIHQECGTLWLFHSVPLDFALCLLSIVFSKSTRRGFPKSCWILSNCLFHQICWNKMKSE